MKKIGMNASAALLILGCVTLGLSLVLSAVLPNIFLVYLTANPASFGHDILYPEMTAPIVFSVIEIIAGIAGMVFFAMKSE